MPFALLIIGIVLLVAGVRGTQSTLFGLLQGDFTGQNNFFYWFAAIVIIGMIGYIPKLKPISTAFLVLVVMVLFLSKGNPQGSGGGLFTQLTSALKIPSSTSATQTSQSLGQQMTAAQNQQTTIYNGLAANLQQSAVGLLQDIDQ